MDNQNSLPKEDRPEIEPDLKSIHNRESLGDNRPPSEDRSGLMDDKEGGLFKPDADSVGKKSPGSSGGKLAGSLSSVSKLTSAGRILSLAKISKRKRIAGGSIVALVVALVFGIVAVTSFVLVDIEKDVIKDVAKIEQHFEQKDGQKIFQKIVNRLKAKTGGTLSDEDSDGELASAMDDFPITNPEIKSALGGEGIAVKTNAGGEFTGLENTSTGEDVTDQVGSDGNLWNKISAALPEWAIAQLKSFVPLMTEHAGATWDGIPEDTPDDQVDKVVDSDIVDGASDQDVLNAEAGDETDQPPAQNDNSAADTADAAQLNTEGGSIGAALKATTKALANGEGGTAAIQAGINAFKGIPDPVLASSLATMGCDLEKSVSEDAKSRVPTITNLLIRHFSLIVAFADQIKLGKASSGTISSFMKLLSGFTTSAAWQRITGSPVNSNPKEPDYTPDISKSALPTVNSGTEIANEVDSTLGAVGGKQICGALSSPFGFIIQGITGAVQFFADIGSFGATQAAITASIIGAQVAMQKVVLPDILKYFTPVGINGGEGGAQWMNNTTAGGTLAYADYARSIGGQPLTTPQANSLSNEAGGQQFALEKQEPLMDRLFALNNPDSLLSKLALSMPFSLQQSASDFSSLLSNFPSILSHGIGTLFMPHTALAATAPTNPGAPYGVTEYGLTDAQLDKYDSIDNEQYLDSTITYDGVTARRIDMAGDPFQYQNGEQDTSTTDLYHCFQEGYADGPNPVASETAPDPICGSMGNYDLNFTPPTPMIDAGVAISYCDYFQAKANFPSIQLPSCESTLSANKNDINDDIGHYEEYVIDSHVMNTFNQLTSND